MADILVQSWRLHRTLNIQWENKKLPKGLVLVKIFIMSLEKVCRSCFVHQALTGSQQAKFIVKTQYTIQTVVENNIWAGSFCMTATGPE